MRGREGKDDCGEGRDSERRKRRGRAGRRTNLNVFLLKSREQIFEIRVLRREASNCRRESCIVRFQLWKREQGRRRIDR